MSHRQDIWVVAWFFLRLCWYHWRYGLKGCGSHGPSGFPKGFSYQDWGARWWEWAPQTKKALLYVQWRPIRSRASSYSPFQRPGNLECLYLQEFARALWFVGGVGYETVMLTKLYFNSKASDGLSLNMNLSMCKREHWNVVNMKCPTVQTSICHNHTSKTS